MAASVPETKHLQVPKDGSVVVIAESDVTEQEIAEDRNAIIERLHASYLNLTDEMGEFQEQWDANPTVAFLESAHEGWNKGGADWLSDQAELFEKKLWVDLGGKIKDAAGTSYDRLATYSKQQYEDIKKDINKHIEKPEDTLYNWAWWQKSIEDTARDLYAQQVQKLESTVSTGKSVLEAADKARKIYQHRDAILNLPALIADGKPKPIQAFVENELMDIDPELAKAIRNDPNFAIVLEIIADNESALTYLSYVGLMMEAIPPNFYAYVAGKGAAYLMIEVILLVVTALLSAGTAAAARITMLLARFAQTSANVATIGNKIRRAKAAIAAFIRVIEDLSNAADDLHNLGAKLLRARGKGLHLKGSTKTTLQVKKESIKRDKKCRLCGSTEHTTPRFKRGTVVYE